MTAPPRAVLDSNVIFSRVLHELLGRVAGSLRLLDLIWSDELLAEAERVLVERKSLTAAQAARWVGDLCEAFPQGRIDIAAVEFDVSGLSRDPVRRQGPAALLSDDERLIRRSCGAEESLPRSSSTRTTAPACGAATISVAMTTIPVCRRCSRWRRRKPALVVLPQRWGVPG